MIAGRRSLADWLAYQQQLHGSAIDLGLERVRRVAERLALTASGCPTAIVGGTNGKGSTSTLLAALLAASGRRTGLFTSPHLVRYNERIRVDGAPVSDAELIQAFEAIEAARAGESPDLLRVQRAGRTVAVSQRRRDRLRARSRARRAP